MIPFHRPYFPKGGSMVVNSSNLEASKGIFAEEIFRNTLYQYYSDSFLLTHSAAAALEMMALLLKIGPGDEIIMPSFTYVATANAFERMGAKIVFADISEEDLNIDVDSVASLITDKTRAIVPIHYGGISADIVGLRTLCRQGIHLIEDAAHTLGALYKSKPLGSYGTLGCMSFHETKNMHALGSGGLLMVNDMAYLKDANEILDQGTNRQAFIRGQVASYKWQQVGSAYEMGPLNKLFLRESMRYLKETTESRQRIWTLYQNAFRKLEEEGLIKLARVRDDAEINGHIFYLLTRDDRDQKALIDYLKSKGIDARRHYEPLHLSDYYKQNYRPEKMQRRGLDTLARTEGIAKSIVRLPIFDGLSEAEQWHVIESVKTFFK